MDVWLRREARAELQDAATWLEGRVLGLGDRFLDDFLGTVETMEANPELYVQVATGIRRALFRQFPFAIFYSVENRHIQILSIKHCHDDPENWPTGA